MLLRIISNNQSVTLIAPSNIAYDNFSFQYRFASRQEKLLIIIALFASVIVGLILPYAITLVANIFQTMITYDKSRKEGKRRDTEFLTSMHKFGIYYSCVGAVLFLCVYLGNAFMNITAINQVRNHISFTCS